MYGAQQGTAAFLKDYVDDEILCRCLDQEEDFGQPLSNEENDVPLYDNFNRGLAVCEQGMERRNLALEGNQMPVPQRPGMTGYIPSMEDSLRMGGSPQPKALILDLGGTPTKEMMMGSAKRRGLSR